MSVFRDLSQDECERLLRAGDVGRVGVATPAGPHIVPVNYSVLGRAVILRTAPYSLLGSHGPDSLLAFEVDHLEPEDQKGWSVVVRGRARAIADPDELERVRETADPTPWADGARTLYLRIGWDEVSGRRLGSGWDVDGELERRPMPRAVADREALALVRERERIARDLHDTVLQRLFAAGMQLQSVPTESLAGEVAARVERAMDELDRTVRDIRSTIFALKDGERAAGPVGARSSAS